MTVQSILGGEHWKRRLFDTLEVKVETVDVHIQLAKLKLRNKQVCHGNQTSIYILYKHLMLLKQLEGKKVCIKEKQEAEVVPAGSRHHTFTIWADCWLWAYRLQYNSYKTSYHLLYLYHYTWFSTGQLLPEPGFTFINSRISEYCI